MPAAPHGVALPGRSRLTPIVGTHVLWVGLVAVLPVCRAVDLWVHRRPRRVPAGSAARWTAAWVGIGLLCSLGVWLLLGSDAFLRFLASYTVEWSLSVDNVFVFVVIVAGLAVPAR